MKYIKIGGLVLLTLAFYIEGFLSNNFVMVWGGHASALMTVIYGYIKLTNSKHYSFSETGRKVYDIFDVIFAGGLFYFFYAMGAFERFSTIENVVVISAIVLIIVGKAIYFYKKDFAENGKNEKNLSL